MKRTEYMERSSGFDSAARAAIHREYYAQWVGPWLINEVSNWIGADRIKSSTHPHFSDIPLAEWDRLDGIIRPYGARRNKEINGESVWSLSDTVCVAKEAAQQIRESA
ncbi:hypothetical protein [Burkholderia cenocepacia]|uniref:hypothetical protein n=1 Tax=Burkholderia cenocepacia TaxID=95486 RepID=UPI002AB62E4B|nr:hypothetical protein [Burkholderia cenocepacia]